MKVEDVAMYMHEQNDELREELVKVREEMAAMKTELLAEIHPPPIEVDTGVFVHPWSSDVEYCEHDIVTHEGMGYRALPDVATGCAPDAVFDLDANTGGWAKIGA